MSVLGPPDLALLKQRLAGLERRRVDAPTLPRAAVLVPLVAIDGAWHVLFMKRTEAVDTHKGQVAFPGGHVEPSDADLVATALREAQEEVGLDPARVEVLGLGHEVVSITDVHVTPVVGAIDGPFDVVTDPHEAAYTFLVPLQFLATPAAVTSHYRRTTRFGELEFPVYGGGPDPIWGLTAWIFTELLPLLKR